MARWLTLLVLPIMMFGLVSCGGGGGDDDDDDGGASTGDDASARQDSSNGTGTVTVDGKDYTLDMQTCELSTGPSKLTVLAGQPKGGDKITDFSASGIEKTVAIAVRFGETGYLAVGAEMTVDGKTAKWDGDLYDSANPGKTVKGKFTIKC